MSLTCFLDAVSVEMHSMIENTIGEPIGSSRRKSRMSPGGWSVEAFSASRFTGDLDYQSVTGTLTVRIKTYRKGARPPLDGERIRGAKINK